MAENTIEPTPEVQELEDLEAPDFWSGLAGVAVGVAVGGAVVAIAT